MVIRCGSAVAEELPEQLQTEFGEIPLEGPTRPGGRPISGAAIFGPERQDPFTGIPTQEDIPLSGQAYYRPQAGAGAALALPGMAAPAEQQPFVPTRSYLSPRDRYAGQESILITGSATLSGRLNFIRGNAGAFDSQFLDTQSLDRTASVYVTGRLTGPFYVNGRIDLRRYAPTLADYSVTYRQSDFDLTFGQLQVNVQRNPFAGFTKSIQGIQATGSYGERGSFEVFAASPKGRVRTDRIPGNGTSGPYRLSFSPVREGSERVRLDERDLSQAEYNLNYWTGFLTFENNMVIPPTSVIYVTYEEDRPGEIPGLLLGFTTSTTVGKLPVGITYISQEVEGGGASEPAVSRPFEERFEGNNSLGPFELSRRPVDRSQPLQVLINGVLQVEGQDYQFIAESGIIQFFDLVPATSTVVVRYFYLDQPAQADSNKQLIGFDTGYSFGNASVGLSWGRSRGGLLSDGSPSPGGDALNLRATLRALGDKLGIGLGLVDVSPTFSRIESATFQRDRRGTDIDVNYAPSSETRLYYRQSQDRSNQGLSLGASPGQLGGEAAGFVFTTLRRNFGGSLSFQGWPQIRFDASQNQSGREGSGLSRLDSLSLSASDQFGSLSLNAALDRSSRGFNPASGASADLTRQRTITSQARTNASLRFGSASSFAVGYSTNDTQDPTGQGLDSSGNGLDFRLSYLPSQNLTLSASRTFARSQGAVFVGTGGLGGGVLGLLPLGEKALASPSAYDLSQDPFLRQAQGDSFIQASTADEISNLSVVYMPSSQLSLNVSASQRHYETTGDIGYEADNESTHLSAGLFYSPSRKLNIGVDYIRSATRYLDRGAVPLTSDSMTFSGNYTPSRRLSMRFGYNLTDAASPFFGMGSSGGGTGTGLTLLTLSSFADYTFGGRYVLSPKMSLLFNSDFSQNRGGIDNSDRFLASLRLQHALTSLLAVNVGLRYINFTDLNLPDSDATENRDYRALSVIAELSARF